METMIQQEILLITGTSFLSRQCWQKTGNDKQVFLSETEQLKEACWNGLLPEMLPEIYGYNIQDKKIFLWQIKENKSALEIDLGELPQITEGHFSIDPYSFLKLKHLS